VSAIGTAPPWVEEVLGYWFGTLTYAQWFKRSDAVDAEIASRFAGLVERVSGTPAEIGIASDPRAVLARIVVLDQFPRNIFRGTARAFATDPAALELARQAVRIGLDRPLGMQERLFVYLPFEHSEDLSDQELSVALISALGDPELTRFAARHHEIILRFGRFPHRNAILGRESTPAEMAFLKEPDSGF
jgi:uncharacterized protein (DUF924 family)